MPRPRKAYQKIPIVHDGPFGIWMTENGITETDIFIECGVPQPTINRARRGEVVRLETAVVLHCASGRQVPIEDLLGKEARDRALGLEGCLVRLADERNAGRRRRPKKRSGRRRPAA